MKILIISDTDDISLGIHKELSTKFDSTLLTLNDNLNVPNVINVSKLRNRRLIKLKNSIRSFIHRNILFKAVDYYYYQDINERNHYYSLSRIKNKINFVPDIIIIFFDYRILTSKTIAELYNWSKAKMIWMLVDMKPFTGGCSYSDNCVNYTIDCSNCPAINNSFFKDYPKNILKDKLLNLKNTPIDIFVNSEFQKKQVVSSSLFKNKNIFKVPFPIDSKVFNTNFKQTAKDKLALPKDKKIIMFGAAKLSEKRKGISFLLKALKMLETKYSKEDLVLLVVGNSNLKLFETTYFETIMLGYVDYSKLSLAYQASDVFVCSSIEDSGPVMVPQSLMCGTPVIAFKMGISIDLIKDGETGYIADLKDEVGLYDGLMRILELSKEQMGEISHKCIEISNVHSFSSFNQKISTIKIST